MQGYHGATGVVLRRKDTPSGDRRVSLLLQGIGPVWASVPGGARGSVRFGGATEPFVWGNFHLYRSPHRLHLRDVDVKAHFWNLRRVPGGLRKALAWDILLGRHLLPGCACDELLPVFFWALRFLEAGVPGEMAEWRFLWKWLRIWGRAPDLERCARCGAPLGTGVWDRDGEGFSCLACVPGAGRQDFLVEEAFLEILRRTTRVDGVRFLSEDFRDMGPGPWYRANGWLRDTLARSG